MIRGTLRRIIGRIYVTPVFRARCESSGPRLSVRYMPYVTGPVRIYIGADVVFKGRIRISGSRTSTRDHPTLRIGNHVVIGDEVTFSVSQEIVIDDEVHIDDGCTITDSD